VVAEQLEGRLVVLAHDDGRELVDLGKHASVRARRRKFSPACRWASVGFRGYLEPVSRDDVRGSPRSARRSAPTTTR
jgi:hypothetical protein